MKRKVLIIEGIFIIAVLVLAIYNICKNKLLFFDMSIFQVLTLMATVVFAFYFTQKMTDSRKTVDMAEKLILKIQEEISDCRFYHIETQADVDYIGIKIRTVANNIDCLLKLSKKLSIETEAKYISDKFNSYETLFGNHISQIEHLKNSNVDFKNAIDCIDNKCTYIITSFYI